MWQDILKNIQISSQRTSSKDYVKPDNDDGDCRRWFEELFNECEEIKDYFSDYETRLIVNKFPELDEDEYCRYRDAILSSEGFVSPESVAFAIERVPLGRHQNFMFRMSMIVYPLKFLERESGATGSTSATICRFQLYLGGEAYLKFRFKCNGIIHADSNMFDKLDSHVNAKGKISNLYKKAKNEVRRRNGYEMV
tara:strand:+ start:1362 stop:1946 length:585 start_codon:yes stop_codon:yes gene_type:complete